MQNLTGILTAALLCLGFLWPATASPQVIFSDTFDAQPDWQSKQYTYLTGGGISWESPTYAGTCTTTCPPVNWTAYRVAQSLWAPNLRDTYLINTTGARGGSGKGVTYNVESTGEWGTWAGGGLDKYLGQAGFQELYVRLYLKEPPEFCWGSAALNLNAMGKLVRITSLRRDPTVTPLLFNPELYPSPDTSPTLIVNAYRRFQPNYGIPAQFNMEERYAPNYEYGPAVTFPAQFPNDSSTGGQGYCGDNNWHAYEFYVKMNSALGATNGIYRTWLDGKLVAEKTDIPWVKPGTDSNGTPMTVATGWNWVMVADNIDSTAYPKSAQVEMARYMDDVVMSTHYSGPPPPPASVAAAGTGATSIKVSWSAGTNGATYLLDGYRIRYGTDSANLNQSVTVAAGATETTITGLATATRYYFSVTAFNKGTGDVNENEGLPTTASGVTVDTTGPTLTIAPVVTPTLLTSQPISGTVSDLGGVASVLVQVGGGEKKAAVLNGNAWSYAVSALPPGQATQVAVTAVDSVGNETTVSATIGVLQAGDLTGDLTVGVDDAQAAMQMAVGIIHPDPGQLLRGDIAPIINGVSRPDRVIDTGDAVGILGIITGVVKF